MPIDVAPPQIAVDRDHRWQAVLARDWRYDRDFVFAVRTTRVYCRPSCPARRPRPEHVVFFGDAHTAEQAGFRPCRRCLPHLQHSPEVDLAREACRLLEESAEAPTLAQLGRQVGVSPYHLQRTFKRVVGISPREYARGRRAARLRQELHNGETVTMAVYGAGYGSSSPVYEGAADLAMTPGDYQRGGEGMQIHYTIVSSALGRLLVASTIRGVCAVQLGDADDELEAGLHAEYPAAQLSRDDEVLASRVDPLVRHLAGSLPHLDLPLDIQASAFQWRVWCELQAIPYGETRSYTEIAQALGKPAAVRAVGHACARNPVAVLIPCHRAVHKDGTLGGYRWGLERKRALLAREQAMRDGAGVEAGNEAEVTTAERCR